MIRGSEAILSSMAGAQFFYTVGGKPADSKLKERVEKVIRKAADPNRPLELVKKDGVWQMVPI